MVESRHAISGMLHAKMESTARGEDLHAENRWKFIVIWWELFAFQLGIRAYGPHFDA